MIIQKLRAHVPGMMVEGKTYLDSAATSYMPQEVCDALSAFYLSDHGSVHRGVYHAAEETTSAYEQVRQDVASFVGATDASEVVFTSGSTDGLNAIAHAWALPRLTSKSSLVITQADHHASVVLWKEIARQTGATIHVIPFCKETYLLDCSSLDDYIDEHTVLVSLPHTSNVVSSLWPSKGARNAVIKKARSVGAAVVLDCAQAAAHEPLELAESGCDFAVFSAHKMGGPTGLGVLYVQKDRHTQMRPYRYGGGMVHSVGKETTFVPMPHMLEAGTPPLAQVIGFGALIAFYKKNIDWPVLQIHESMLCYDLISGLEEIEGVCVLGNKELAKKHGHVVSFIIDDIHAHDVAHFLGTQGVCVRAGDHCAQPLSAVWGGKATVRVSFMYYNTHGDVASLIKALRKGIALWREKK